MLVFPFSIDVKGGERMEKVWRSNLEGRFRREDQVEVNINSKGEACWHFGARIDVNKHLALSAL